MFLDLFVFADHLLGGVNILDMFTGRMDYKKIILVGFPPPPAPRHSFNKDFSASLAPSHINVLAKKDKVIAHLVEFPYFYGGGRG